MILHSWKSSFSRLLLFLFVTSFSSAVYIENNGYKDVVLSFLASINENDVRPSNLKAILEASSQYLFHATRRRSYLSSILVVTPSSWDESFCNAFQRVESIQTLDVSIYVQRSPPARTQHSKGCDQKGEIIFLPLDWFTSDQTDNDVKDLARQFVQQWAIYRYGVFEENPLWEGSCYSTAEEIWSPTGCYNVKINDELSLDSSGLPVCYFKDDFISQPGLTSSIMFDTKSLNITDFCDGSAIFPHSPISHTRHNVLCDKRPVWEVIKNSEDFQYGRNSPMGEEVVPKLTIKCFQEKKHSLLFAVQNASDTADISEVVMEVRLSLLRFLLYSASPDTKVTVITFSDETETEKAEPVVLNLMEKEASKTSLKKYIRVIDEVAGVCVSCGLKKAASVLNTDGSIDTAIAFVSLASAVQKTNIQEFLEILSKLMQPLYFYVIVDVDGATIPSAIVQGIHKKEGQIFYLPVDTVLLNAHLNSALVNVLRNPFHLLEENIIIVHQATFSNIASSIEDKFSVDAEIEGQIVYTFKCDNTDILDIKNSGCSDLKDFKDVGYQCGMISELKSTNESQRSWKFNFVYLGGSKSSTCSSLATVRLQKGKGERVTFRGWLNHYKVKPGREALVIYAEVLKGFNSVSGVKVDALIYRPKCNVSSPFILELWDNGNGDPDVKKDDGIYSRYFSSFTTKGIYLVLLKVRFPPAAFGATNLDNQITNSRLTTLGSFVVTDDPPEVDIYPPNRIADLRVIEVDHDKSAITLQWTAPGNDYDYGRALSYEVKISETWSNLIDVAFNTVPKSLVPIDEAETPHTSGTMEKRRFWLPTSKNDIVYFIAIKAQDNSEERLPISNIVQAFVKGKMLETTSYTPDLNKVSTTEVTDTEIDTDGSNKTNDITSTETTVVTEESTTETDETTLCPMSNVTTQQCSDCDRIIVLASSVGGGSLLLIILVNAVVCACCCSPKKRGPKKLTKRQSMLPPHNMDIAYKERTANPKAASSVESIDELVQTDEYATPNYQYSFFTNSNFRSSALNTDRIRPQRADEYGDYRNAFQLANAVPANVIPALDLQNTSVSSIDRQSSLAPNQSSAEGTMVVGDAQVYHLGSV